VKYIVVVPEIASSKTKLKLSVPSALNDVIAISPSVSCPKPIPVKSKQSPNDNKIRFIKNPVCEKLSQVRLPKPF
jgi:hypothetical protein